MLNTTLRGCRTVSFTRLLHLKQSFSTKYVATLSHGHCVCGNLYLKDRTHNNIFISNLRVHSTSSDQHRQKAVIQNTAPRISIDKKVGGERSSLMSKIDPYIKLSRWDRPIGVYLLFWPCAWSLALGSLPGDVSPATTLYTAGLFLAGAGLMRGAGCTINDLWDRDIDAQVERTKQRPLVSGALTETEALLFLAAQLALALAVLLQLNCCSVVLGASSLVLVATYPLAKRYTEYPQVFLGATFNWGALLGYSALRGGVDPAVCLPLYAGALAWTVLYDTVYAHQDKEDDARIGIKSTALTFGRHTKPALYATLAATAAGLSLAGANAGLAAPYYAALGVACSLAASQVYQLDVDNPEDCAVKFRANSYFGLIVLLGILAGGARQYRDNRARFRGQERDSAKSCVFS